MILVVVCHPDDEALWFGGSLHALCKQGLKEVNVICLSGRDPGSLRENEFHAARMVAGYNQGVVLGYPLRDAHQSLPDIVETVEQGLQKLGSRIEDIELLITHSPYGDEHRHPHHVQAFKELLRWSRRQRLAFGYFCTVPLPTGSVRSLLRNFRRQDSLHLTFLGKCSYGLRDWLNSCFLYGVGWLPKYYVQWQIDAEVKRSMLQCYPSIGLEQHKQGYAMYTSHIESFYLMDRAGLRLIETITEPMEIPGPHDLFAVSPRLRILASRIYRKIRNALHT